MSRLGTIGKVAGIAAGVVAGARRRRRTRAQRVAAARVRRNPDGDAARALDAPIYIDRRLDAHRRRRRSTSSRTARARRSCSSHGVTNSMRTWFHQLETLPAAGFRAIAFDHRGHGKSVLGYGGSLAREPGARPANRDRGARPARRGARRPLDGRRRGAGVRRRSSRSSRPSASPASCCSRRSRETPLGSHSTRTKARDRADHQPRARHELAVVVAEPRLPARAARLRARSAAEPRRARAPDAGRVPARDAARRAARADRPRPDRRAPERRSCRRS